MSSTVQAAARPRRNGSVTAGVHSRAASLARARAVHRRRALSGTPADMEVIV